MSIRPILNNVTVMHPIDTDNYAYLINNKSNDEIINILIKTTDSLKLNSLFFYFINRPNVLQQFNFSGNLIDYKQSYIYQALQYKNYLLVLYLIYFGAKIDYKFTYFENSLLYDCMKNYNKFYPYIQESQEAVVTCLLLNNVQFIYINDNIHTLTPYLYAIHQNYSEDLCEYIYNRVNKLNKPNNLISKYITNIISNRILNNYYEHTLSEFNKYKRNILLKINGMTNDDIDIILYNYKLSLLSTISQTVIDVNNKYKTIINRLNKYHFLYN